MTRFREGDFVCYSADFCRDTSTTAAGLKDMSQRLGRVVAVFGDGKLCNVDWGDYITQFDTDSPSIVRSDYQRPVLRLSSTDNGNCRVYYRGDNRALYCFQESSRGNFDFLICSRDEEPSHDVSLARRSFDKLPADDCVTARNFIAWIARNKAPLSLTIGDS